jgi:hypothetical protein
VVPPDAGPTKRTVETRNPFGGPAKNLFADGDFEFSTVAEGSTPQLGWLGFTENGSGEKHVPYETGGLCRTGLHCAVLEQGTLLFGRGTAAPGGQGHVVSIWAKIPAGEECAVVTALMINCDSFATAKKLKAELPDEGGWCEYAGTIPERDSALCLFIQNDLAEGAVAILDSATLLPDDGATKRSLEYWAPSPQIVARVSAVQERIRQRMPFGGSAPSGPAVIAD